MEVNKTPYPVAHFNHLCKTDKEKEKEFYPPCDTEFLSPLDSIPMGSESKMQLNVRLTHNTTKDLEPFQEDDKLLQVSMNQHPQYCTVH